MSEAKRWDGPPVEAWSMAWTPLEAAGALAGVTAPWAVAAGWSLDLWHGRQTREHEDLEITVPAAWFPEIRQRLESLGLTWFVIDDGNVIELARGEAPAAHTHQTWVSDPAARAWRMDVFREPGDAQTWIYRRETGLEAPRARMMGHTPEGIPFVAPQVALLFKAKAARDKDEADFALAAPKLDPEARAWLIEALRRYHPGHPWIERL